MMERGCWGNPEAALPTRRTLPGNPQPLAAPQSGHVSGNCRASSHKGPHPPLPLPSVTSCLLPSLLGGGSPLSWVWAADNIRGWGCNIPTSSQTLTTPHGRGFLGTDKSNNWHLQCWFYHVIGWITSTAHSFWPVKGG